jgi:iron complex outermembrane receptor protein
MKGKTNGTTLQFGGGEFGTIRSAAIQAGTYDKLSYRLSFGHDQNEQWQDRNQLALRADKFNVLTEYRLTGDSKLAVSGGLVDSNRFDGQVFDVIHEKSTIANGYANVEYRQPDFFVRANWIRWAENRQELADSRLAPFVIGQTSDGNVNQIYSQDGYNLESQHALVVGTANRLTYGFNYRHNDISANFLDQHFVQENRLGLYLQDEWRATKTLTAVAGFRWDLHTEINPTYSPRFALLYRPSQDHSLRFSFSQAYRPPTVVETHSDVFFFFPTFGVATESVGSRHLDPEKITSYEMGYQGWYLKHRLRFRVDAFYNHLSDFIIGVAAPAPLTVTFANAGKADIWGGETGVEFLATSWLTGFANYSFVNIWQSTDLQGTRGAPPYKANAGLRGEWENGVSAEAAVHHVSATSSPIPFLFGFFATVPPPFGGAGSLVVPDTRVGSYTLVNLRGAYQFWRERAEVAVAVYSAVNDHHRENPVGDSIGSRVMGWLTIKY